MKLRTLLSAAFFASAIAGLPAGCADQTIGGPCEAFVSSRHPDGACGQQMYFPTGLAIDPRGNVLYVSNGNADLRYGSGTVEAIDLTAFNCAYDYTRSNYSAWGDNCPAKLRCALDHARKGFPHPAADPTCDLGELDALFNATNQARIGKNGVCRPDLLDSSIIECDEQLLITGSLAAKGAPPPGAVLLGNFAGEVRVQPRITCPAVGGAACNASTRRLWIAVRGDPSITYVNVNGSGADTSLDCGDGTEHDGLPASCAPPRITVRDYHDPKAPGVGCSSADFDRCVPLPAEPFGVAYEEDASCARSGRICARDADCAQGGDKTDTCVATNQRVLVSHLLGGEVTLIDAGVDRPTSTPDDHPLDSVVLDVRGVGLPADSTGRRGGFGLADRVPGNPNGLWYASSRVSPIVAVFRVGFSNVILPVLTFNVSGAFASGDDVRDLVFDPCDDQGAGNAGCRAFFIQNHPPSLFTLDTRIDPVRVPAGLPRNVVSDIVAVCQGPSHIAFRRFAASGGAPAYSRVYVLCYSGNQMAVVDPDQARLIDSALVGRGPNEMAFNFGPGIDAPDAPKNQPHRAFVTNFLDNSISVVDLEPGSGSENHVIARIGFTEPPRLN